MAHAQSTVPEFCQAIIQSKLLDPAVLERQAVAWQKQGGAESDVDGFRKQLVRAGFITEYQAALILRGRLEGFFIGGYVIQDRIGSGQTAGVYKAVHTTTGQVVALKVLPSSKGRDLHTLNRFQREGRLLTQLDHPNVVRAYQLAQAGNVHYIVMEHLEGETLDEVITRRKKLPPDEAVRLVHQAFQGLDHLHSKKMVHRDLKPANLMVCPGKQSGQPDSTLEATLRILDIGLGRELFQDNDTVTHDLQLTGEGALLGTPDYLAPEQARDARNADIRADIYSLGCVLYHLLSGRTPFPDKNVMSQMVRHATEKPQAISELVKDLPKNLEKVLFQFLEKSPDARPATPAEAAELLKPFLPSKAVAASRPKVLPAYQEWLESESMMELPPSLKPGTAPSPALTTPSVPEPPREKAAAIASESPAKSSGVAQPPKKKTAPIPQKPITRPEPLPEPVSKPIPEYNVELVTLPEYPPATAPPVEEEPKSIWELSRRDFVLLGLGAVGILTSIGVGYTLARVLRKKEPDPAEPDENN
jgi:serine/threonine protein kinase